MVACASCAHENRDGAKFCEECAAPLSASAPLAEERKVVSALFCDLVGINTGEALVRLGVERASGEGFLAGDAVNTAARLQAAAPELGVAVGLSTYEATAGLFEYEELPSVSVKGKAEPVRIFHARATR